MLLLVGSYFIFLFIAKWVIPHFQLQAIFQRPTTQPISPEMARLPVPQTPLAITALLMMNGAVSLGVLAALAAFFGYCVNPEARRWVEKQLGWLALRPLPAIRLIDFIAIYALEMWVMPLNLIWLHALFNFDGRGMGMSAIVLANDMAMAVAIAVAAAIAFRRAGGWHGTRGFWPAWSGEHVRPRRPIWMDIALGVACYPLTLWMSALANFLNAFLVSAPDQHFMIAEFARHPPPLAAGIFIAAGTFGAAFFEETLYRGVLYNALRRWLGGPAGAILASFIFASMHQLKSNMIGLFVLGMIMTWLYDKTGRLIAGMAFHFTNNFVSLVLTLILYNQ